MASNKKNRQRMPVLSIMIVYYYCTLLITCFAFEVGK